jgi:hypothetical protein
MSNRAIVPSKINSKTVNGLNELLPSEAMNFFMPVAMLGAFGLPFLIGLGATVSLYFLLILVPILVVLGFGFIHYQRNTLPTEYSFERTAYTNAYTTFSKITDPVDRDAGRVLLDNIWKHELSYEDRQSHGGTYYGCDTCSPRHDLLKELASSQVSIGTEDIQRVKDHIRIKKEVMKELGM